MAKNPIIALEAANDQVEAHLLDFIEELSTADRQYVGELIAHVRSSPDLQVRMLGCMAQLKFSELVAKCVRRNEV